MRYSAAPKMGPRLVFAITVLLATRCCGFARLLKAWRVCGAAQPVRRSSSEFPRAKSVMAGRYFGGMERLPREVTTGEQRDQKLIDVSGRPDSVRIFEREREREAPRACTWLWCRAPDASAPKSETAFAFANELWRKWSCDSALAALFYHGHISHIAIRDCGSGASKTELGFLAEC
jgi:hypothetical protein